MESFESALPLHVHYSTTVMAQSTMVMAGWQVGWCIGPKRLIAPIHQLLPSMGLSADELSR